MKHQIFEEGQKLIVKASLKTRTFARDPVESITTKDILALLRESGYNVDKYRVIKEGSCTNYKTNSIISSEWVLELFEEKKEEEVVKSSKKPRARRRTTRKQKSSEDKLLGIKDMGGVQSQAQTDIPGRN